MCSQNLFGQGALPSPGQGRCSHFVQPWGGAQTPNRVLAQDLDEPCLSSPGIVLCGFYGVHTDKIYRRIGGFRVVVRQKHAEVANGRGRQPPRAPGDPRTQQTRHECPQTRSERLLAGGPARGLKNWVNLKELEELLEKEKTVSTTCIIITVASPSLSWRYGLRVRVTGRLS